MCVNVGLDELIYNCFAGNEKIVEKLAVFSSKPAIFCGHMPEESDGGWETGNHYPKIRYRIQMEAEKEKNSIGKMEVSLFSDSGPIQMGEIEANINNSLKHVFFKADVERYDCFRWSRAEILELEGSGNNLGITTKRTDLFFDILEYPSQEMTEPNPIAVLNGYIKQLIPQAIVMGLDSTGESIETTLETPVIYSCMETLEKGAETNSVVWLNCKGAICCISPSSEVRLKISTFLANQLSLDGELIMLDGSPLKISGVQINNKADYLSESQLIVTMQYGLLRNKHAGHKINGINFNLLRGGCNENK